ncbi:MAG TPA: DUF4139 domain-containing protein [Candidatus Polarisedimenticolia bacterium]|nr:DUF4139 domain-containing protein [Candidatus Polarisedimenticolia bacterium]
MKSPSHVRLVAPWLVAVALPLAAAGARAAEAPQITIYNQNFALVKDIRPLTLKEGVNEVRVTDVTALLEPDSVILRDPKDPKGIQILEQNYEGDPLSEGFLLRQYEGKTLQFQWMNPATGKPEIRTGRVIRSGYVPHQAAWQTFGGEYMARQQAIMSGGGSSPIVEVDGKIQFNLPGQPLFDALGADAILKPTILWKLWSDHGGARDVEMSYITGGMRWEATYNLVAPEKGDRFDLVGWVTLDNESGSEFKEAQVKLMAGEVNKIQPGVPLSSGMRLEMMAKSEDLGRQVTEKAFDEYHLYTLQRPTTLKDREIKQVEFCRGSEVPGARLYVYDGAQVAAYGGWDPLTIRNNPEYGTQSNTKVFTMIEFTNSKAAGLGMPLPKGTLKIYRADADGRREFIGENAIDHTPADEKVRVYLGNAFDLVGERKQTAYQVDSSKKTADEAFEIKVRNHKKEAVEVRVVEHLYRWTNWKIQFESDPHLKTDAQTVEFRVKVPPDGEKVITYRAHYSW